MLDYIMKNKEWIFSGIGISILGILFWFFKDKSRKSNQTIKDGNSNQLITGEGNQLQKSGENSDNYQAGGDINITNGISIDQIPEILSEALKTINSELPVAYQQAKDNMAQYSGELTPKLKHLTIKELQNLGEPDVIAVLMQSMREAARTDEIEVHQVLSEAVTQRMKIGKADLKRLAFNLAVDTTLKLDSNLLRILSILFFITHVKKNGYLTLDQFIEFNREFFVDVFDAKISSSCITYLQAVGCGVVQPFSSSRVGEIFLNEYKFLFYGEVPSDELNAAQIREEFKILIFPQVNEKYFIDCGYLYVLQNGWEGINIQGPNAQDIVRLISSISDEEKNKILNFISKFRINADEVEKLFVDKIPECQNLIEQLKKNHHLFKLTPVGSAIALSFWKSKGKELDVNIWIN